MPRANAKAGPTANAKAKLRAADFRFALRPRWLLLHLGALAGLALMITACFWQLSRLHDKQERNRLYAERAAQPTQPVQDVLAVDADDATLEAVRFRLLSATGRYLVDEEVFVRSRSLDGQPGSWVLTPLELDAAPGVAVIVNRGWIPSVDTTPTLPAGAEAPAGTVTVSGLVMAGEQRGAFGSAVPDGELEVIARIDLPRLQQQIEPRLLGAYLQLQAQQPAPTEPLPALVPPPPPDEGPHRSYAGQWAIFAVIWVFGYPMLVRRSAIRRRQDRTGGDADRAQEQPQVLSLGGKG